MQEQLEMIQQEHEISLTEKQIAHAKALKARDAEASEKQNAHGTVPPVCALDFLFRFSHTHALPL